MEAVQNFFGKHTSTVFCYEDQMNMHQKNAMSSSSNVIVFIHRPKYNNLMKRLQAFKFELMPTGEQKRLMSRFSGTCRFVYNKALALQKENYETGNKFISYGAMAAFLPIWKRDPDFSWLKEAPSQALQHALKDLDKAYSNFFAKRADFPRFKRKGCSDSFRYPDPKQIHLEEHNNRIHLPKLGWLRYRNSRKILGTLRNVTVSKSAGKWYLSIQTYREVENPISQASSAIGIDVGIARFATLNDATYIAPLNSFKTHQHRLARYQRRMSRKVTFSATGKRRKPRYKRFIKTLLNARKDFLHKTTTDDQQKPRARLY